MANLKRAYAENTPGDFFVDDTCIDCDLCRQIAPSVFREDSDHSIVANQPVTKEDVHKSLMALVACPTGSIGTQKRHEMKSVLAAFPESVDENVYFCGYASPDSYGAASYLILRPEGNVLVDSPRFARNLVQRFEDLGGISTMFLTHRDDVADHEKYRAHFGCRRIIHRADSDIARGIQVEEYLEGDDPIALDPELRAVPVPGHTRGSAVLLYRDKYLFSGDHLAWSDRKGRLVAFRDVAWYSWPVQTSSMERLLNLRFEWVLPGHGRRAQQPADVMHKQLVECIEWMKSL